MPTSPTLAEGLAEPLLRLYLEAELILLRKVARRLERGIMQPGWAYNRGVAGALTDLRQAKIPEDRGIFIGDHFCCTSEATVSNMVVELVNALQATHWLIFRATTDAYREVVAKASAQVVIGSLARREAAQLALNRLLGRGISGFVDSSGARWELASYVEMAMRTGAGNAAVLGHVGRLQAAGEDLLIVSNAPGECPLCRPWEGRILSASGNSREHPSLATARASGLFHPRCRHSTGLYVEGLSRPMGETADPQGYEARQEQRYLERQVRLWKRREVLALDDGEAAQARAKVREWTQRPRGSAFTYIHAVPDP